MTPGAALPAATQCLPAFHQIKEGRLAQHEIKPSAASPQRHVWTAAGLFLLTVLVFIQCTRFDFINLDDPQYVASNDRVLKGLSWENARWAFTTLRMANWHPLTWLSYMLDAELFGRSAGGYHAVNVVLHAINAALLYLVLVSMTAKPWHSAVAAALFAVHPLRMESVAWVAERKDVLCALFFIGAIGCHARYAAARSWRWYAAVVGCFVLGMLSKPMIVTLPFVLLLMDAWPLKRPERWIRLVGEKLPLFALSALSSVITYVAQRRGGATDSQQVYSLSMRLGNAVWAYGRYLKKTLWPDDLAIFYPYIGAVRGTRFPWGAVGISATVLVGVTLVGILMWKRQRAVLVGWLWFLGVAVPTIGLVQVGGQSMADRYSYLPHIGLLIALVWGAGELVKPRFALFLACAAVAALAGTTLLQLRHWRSSFTVYTHALKVTERNTMANVGLGMWFNRNGQGDQAMAHYIEALKIDPTHATAHSNLGGLLHERGDLRSAYRHLRAALDTNPKSVEAHNNLANVLADRGNESNNPEHFHRALEHHARAIELDPDSAESHYNYGVTLARLGRWDEAIARLEHALRLRPTYTNARFIYAMTLAEAGRGNRAREQFNRVMRERSNWVEAMARFAWLLATSPKQTTRDPQTAVALAEHANQLTLFEQPVLLDTLGAAQASAGLFEQAAATALRARDLAARRGQEALARQIDKRIALYQSGRPFVASTQPTTAPQTSPSIPAANPDNPIRPITPSE